MLTEPIIAIAKNSGELMLFFGKIFKDWTLAIKRSIDVILGFKEITSMLLCSWYAA